MGTYHRSQRKQRLQPGLYCHVQPSKFTARPFLSDRVSRASFHSWHRELCERANTLCDLGADAQLEGVSSTLTISEPMKLLKASESVELSDYPLLLTYHAFEEPGECHPCRERRPQRHIRMVDEVTSFIFKLPFKLSFSDFKNGTTSVGLMNWLGELSLLFVG